MWDVIEKVMLLVAIWQLAVLSRAAWHAKKIVTAVFAHEDGTVIEIRLPRPAASRAELLGRLSSRLQALHPGSRVEVFFKCPVAFEEAVDSLLKCDRTCTIAFHTKISEISGRGR